MPRIGGGWRGGLGYLAAAVIVLVWPGPTIRVLALVVGIALVVGGVDATTFP